VGATGRTLLILRLGAGDEGGECLQGGLLLAGWLSFGGVDELGREPYR